MLEEKTQLPVLGVVPYLRVEIEDEDSLSDRLDTKAAVKPLDIAILRLPHVSNFTDFIPLEQHPLLGVRYVQRTRQLGAPDLVILPGTKNTMDDLRWLRESGLEAAVLRLSAAGTPVLGVCGGYQMLGEQLCDPAGEESGTPCTLRGLGLLPTTTVFGTEKHLTQTAACVTTEPFAGAKLTGYEIHAGRTEVRGSAFCILADGTPEGCVQDGVFGTYLHGLFDTGELTEKLTAFLCKRKGIDPAGAELIPMEQYRQQQFDLLFHLLDGRLQFGDLAASHFAHLLVLVVGEDVLGFGQVGQRRAVTFRGFDDRLQLLVLLVELHELFDVGDDFGVGEFLPRLLVFEFQAVETAQNAVVCHKSLFCRQRYAIIVKRQCAV